MDGHESHIIDIALKNNLLDKEAIDAFLARRDDVKATDKTIVSVEKMLVQTGIISKEKLQKLIQSDLKAIGGYKIIRKIGEGGMGLVYLAKQISMNRDVALKILPRKQAGNPQFIARFQREARTAAQLNHPNIVAGIDVGEDKGYHYFVMEYVPGVNLKSLMDKKNGALSEEYCVYVVQQIVRGLKHAAEKNIIHRDIKPENIIISPGLNEDGTSRKSIGKMTDIVKITDMGLAKFTDVQQTMITQVGATIGTPHYMSPEQAMGAEDIDFRTDMYSLGATFYHMAVGNTPFSGKTTAEIIVAHVNSPVEDPKVANPRLSEATAGVIMRMMEKKKEDRYDSNHLLLADLNCINQKKTLELGSLPSQQMKRVSTEKVEKSGSKKKIIVALVAVFFILVVLKQLSKKPPIGEEIETAIKPPDIKIPAAPPLELKKGLLAHWKMDDVENESPLDSQSNIQSVNHGAEVQRSGHQGASYHFDGDGEFVSVGVNEKLKLKRDLSISTWVYVEHYGQWAGIAGWIHDEGPGKSSGYLLCTQKDKTFAFALKTQNAEIFFLPIENNKLNEWTHLAATYNGKVLKLYVNGELKRQALLQGDIDWSIPANDGFEIGRMHDKDETRCFKGKIDNLRVYDRALEHNKIKALAAEKNEDEDVVHAVNTLSYHEKSKGWKLLFDGESLDNWQGAAGPIKGWQVRDGTIEQDTVKGLNNSLYSKALYTNFELKLEWKVAEGSYSAVMLRCLPLADLNDARALKMAIDSGQPLRVMKRQAYYTGSIRHLFSHQGSAIERSGVWNHVHIKVHGKNVVFYLNGFKTVDTTIDSSDWNQRKSKSIFTRRIVKLAGAESGRIGFKNMRKKVWFRNIRVREIK
jgi:serine/threonine protein kinase